MNILQPGKDHGLEVRGAGSFNSLFRARYPLLNVTLASSILCSESLFYWQKEHEKLKSLLFVPIAHAVHISVFFFSKNILVN